MRIIIILIACGCWIVYETYLVTYYLHYLHMNGVFFFFFTYMLLLGRETKLIENKNVQGDIVEVHKLYMELVAYNKISFLIHIFKTVWILY